MWPVFVFLKEIYIYIYIYVCVCVCVCVCVRVYVCEQYFSIMDLHARLIFFYIYIFITGKPTVPLTTQPPTTQPPTTPPTTTSAPTTPPPTTPAPATPAPTRGPSATVQPTTKPSQPKDKRVFLCNFPYKGGMSSEYQPIHFLSTRPHHLLM